MEVRDERGFELMNELIELTIDSRISPHPHPTPNMQADCVVIIGGKSKEAGKWMDDTCDSKRGYICQTHPGEFYLTSQAGLVNYFLKKMTSSILL